MPPLEVAEAAGVSHQTLFSSVQADVTSCHLTLTQMAAEAGNDGQEWTCNWAMATKLMLYPSLAACLYKDGRYHSHTANL